MSIKRLKALIAPLALAGLLAACATGLNNQLAAAAVSLQAAETAASTYAALPRCGTTPKGTLCSDPATIAAIHAADAKAYDSLVSAEKVAVAGGTPDMVAVNAAIAALSAAIPTAATSKGK